MREDLSPEAIAEASDQLARVVTSPQYLEIAAEINALPAEERLEATRDRLTVDALRERGFEAPEALRISPRLFEPPEDGALPADSAPTGEEVLAHTAVDQMQKPTLCVSVGEIVCVSYGSD